MSELTVAGAAEQDMQLREAASHGAEGLERRLTIALAGGVLLAATVSSDIGVSCWGKGARTR